MKRALALGAVTGLMAFGIAPVAHAGEVTGGKEPRFTPISRYYAGENTTAASLCAFSGLDDVDEGEGETPEGETEPTPDDFGRTQNYGQLPSFVKQGNPGPGRTCSIKAGAEEPH
jgi:hypothetical protein